MDANKRASARTLKSDLQRVDSQKISDREYEELPELTEDMIKRGTVKRAGRPIATDPRRQVTIRIPESVLATWKATGPGWQTRMADLLTRQTPGKRVGLLKGKMRAPSLKQLDEPNEEIARRFLGSD